MEFRSDFSKPIARISTATPQQLPYPTLAVAKRDAMEAVMPNNLSVAIAGAGLSGLCLAQKLVAAGVDVRVYERDPTPETRRQGYRITLDRYGIDALRRSLPPPLFDVAMATASRPAEKGHFIISNSRLGIVMRATFESNLGDFDFTTPRQFDRATLRAVLLSGIEERVSFGRRVVSATSDDRTATLQFDDGNSIQTKIGIGADGVHSPLRTSLLPNCEPVDTGSRAIYGRCPLIVNGVSIVPEPLKDSGLLAIGLPGSAFFFTTMPFGEPPVEAFARAGLSQSAPIEQPYLMWAVIFRRQDVSRDIEAMEPDALFALAKKRAREFHPLLRQFVELSDQYTIVPVTLRAAVRPESWPYSRLALIGDAAHVMPPFESGGGNTALRDASLLGDRLLDYFQREARVEEVVAAYNREMDDYAFPLVRTSTKQLERLNFANPVARSLVLRLWPAIRSIWARSIAPDAKASGN